MWCEGQRQAVVWESRVQTVGARAQTMCEEGRHLWRQQLTATSSSVRGSEEAEGQIVLWTMGPTEENQVLHWLFVPAVLALCSSWKMPPVIDTQWGFPGWYQHRRSAQV